MELNRELDAIQSHVEPTSDVPMRTASFDLKTVSIVDECAVNDLSPEVSDANAVADALEEKPFGTGFNIAIPEDRKKPFYDELRSAAIRRGFSITTRSSDSGFRVFKQEPKVADAKVDQMQRLRGEGLTFQAIGDRFGITRERARQLTICVKKFSTLPPGEGRTEEFLKFAEPFVAVVHDRPSCIVCHEPQARKRLAGVCQACRNMINVLTTTASCIRDFKKTGNKPRLSNAIKNIRKYNLQPEDLELM